MGTGDRYSAEFSVPVLFIKTDNNIGSERQLEDRADESDKNRNESGNRPESGSNHSKS